MWLHNVRITGSRFVSAFERMYVPDRVHSIVTLSRAGEQDSEPKLIAAMEKIHSGISDTLDSNRYFFQLLPALCSQLV